MHVITKTESPPFAVPKPSSQRASERGLVCVFPYLFLQMQLGLFKNKIPRPAVSRMFSSSLGISWRPVPTETNSSFSFFTQQPGILSPGHSVKCIQPLVHGKALKWFSAPPPTPSYTNELLSWLKITSVPKPLPPHIRKRNHVRELS